MTHSTVEFSKTNATEIIKAQPVRVLHVDDDAAFLRTAKPILEMQGAFQVETALSVEEAAEKMKKEKYDAVICDYQMPGKDGLQFLRELRQEGDTIPFIMFTGKGREEVSVKALNLGADGYFDKAGQPETVYCELAHGIRLSVGKRVAEKEVWHREEKLKAVLASSPDAILITDLNGNVVDCNEAALGLGGYSSKEEVVGRNALEFISEKDRSAVLENLKKRSELGIVRNVEYAALKKNGGSYIAEASGSILKDSVGNPAGFVSVIKDITERKKSEKVLRDSEEKYRSLVEQSMQGIVIAQGSIPHVVFANSTMARILGYTVEELLSLSPQQTTGLVHADDRELFFGRFRDRLEGKPVPQQYEIRGITKGGTVVWLGLSSARIEYGGQQAVQAIFTDITERKKTEEALHQSEEKFRKVFDVSPVGVTVFNPVKKIVVDCNPSFEKICGYSREEIVGKDSAKIWKHPDEREKNIPTLLKEGYVEVKGVEIVTKSGETRLVDGCFTAFNINGEAHSISNLIDITERKKIEAALRESQKKFQDLTETTSDFIWEMDPLGRYTYCSPQMEKLWGIKPTEMIGKTPFDVMPPDEKEKALKYFGVIGNSPKPFRLESTSYDTQGHLIFLEIGGVPFFDDKGRLLGFRGISRDATERKKAEDALRQSEERYRELTESIGDVFFAMDKDFRYTYWNKASEKLTGISAKDAIGKSLTEVFPYVKGTKMEQVYLKTLRTHQPQSYLNKYQLEGKDYVFEINAYPTKTGLSVFVKDITERKKTEELVRASEERYRSYIEVTGQLGWTTNANGEVDEDIPAWRKFTGQSHEEVKGWGWTKALHPDDLEHTTQVWKEAVATKSAYEVEYRIRKYDGVYRNFLAHGVPVFNEDGSIREWVGTCIDITERKKAEEELKSSEQKFRGLVEDSAAAIATIDLKRRLTYVNKALADLFGYSIQEMSGRAFIDFLHPDDRGRLMRLFLKAIVLRRQPRKFEFRALREDGAILHLTCKPTRLETAGKTMGFQAIIMDNTTEKHTLERTEKMNEKLSVVGGLTRHDANNKLSTILNVSYLLKQKLRDNQSLELVKETESAVHQIEGLFEFARIYEKLGTEELAYVDAEKAFNEAARLFPSLHGIKVVNEYHGLTVFADSLLRQLFYNLIDNSLKHGEKVSQVRVHYQTREDHLKLIYEDDGIGIPKAEKDRIFKEGYGKDGGHGLYLIKKMCEVYRWTIQETGKQGKGAQFIMTIPRTNKEGKENYRLS